ncbi:MAG TPA: rod-binding protein [Lachnospiraceae bacterium]|nr:rod-binding protein [Lachnospiraceae bacterium]
MDISNLSGSYSDLYTSTATQSSGKLEGELGSDYAKATDEELMDACKKFESYFIEQMFKEMMKSIPESEDSSSSMTSLKDYMKDNLVQEVASESTQQDNLGLAQILFNQMKHNYEC